MESTRQTKVARQVQKDLGEIFQRQAQSHYQGHMITVTQVRMSPDLGLARVYISIFPAQKREEILTEVKTNTRSIRHELGKRVRHQLRIVPDLNFYLDDSLDYIENIDRLLKK